MCVLDGTAAIILREEVYFFFLDLHVQRLASVLEYQKNPAFCKNTLVWGARWGKNECYYQRARKGAFRLFQLRFRWKGSFRYRCSISYAYSDTTLHPRLPMQARKPWVDFPNDGVRS